MSDTIFVRPVEGRTVKDPHTRVAIPEAGVHVPDEPHWRQLVHFGDLEITKAPEPEAPAKGKEKAPPAPEKA